MYFTRSLFLPGLAAILLALFAGCQDAPAEPPAWQQEKSGLELRLAGFQRYYDRIQCLQEALEALELLDHCLDYGVSLEHYQIKIISAQTRLQALDCDPEGQAALKAVLDYHLLAARLWQARNQGRAGGLAEEFVRVVWPLWREFALPLPRAMNSGLAQSLDQYARAAEPVARQTLNQITMALNSPAALPELAQNANQALWHQAHRQLAYLRGQVLGGKDLPGF